MAAVVCAVMSLYKIAWSAGGTPKHMDKITPLFRTFMRDGAVFFVL